MRDTTNDQDLLEDDEDIRFDFKVLNKFKRRERQRVVALVFIIAVLAVLLLTVGVLYAKKECSKIDSIQTVKYKAYKRIATYGEKCSTSKDCSAHAFCTRLQGTDRCQCERGFVGDGIGDCKDIDFTIDFTNSTIKDIPKLSNVKIPKTDGLSVCFWYSLQQHPKTWKAIFSFVSNDVRSNNDLMLRFQENNLITSMKGIQQVTGNITFKLDWWKHICWTWRHTGEWKLYFNGHFLQNGASKKKLISEPFPESIGRVNLGEDIGKNHIHDPKKLFEGSLTGLYIYSKTLSDADVMSIFQNHIIRSDVVVGWWQFKNTTRGKDISEKPSPFGSKIRHRWFKKPPLK